VISPSFHCSPAKIEIQDECGCSSGVARSNEIFVIVAQVSRGHLLRGIASNVKWCGFSGLMNRRDGWGARNRLVNGESSYLVGYHADPTNQHHPAS